MSKHCQLIVYEPHKSPRTVDLHINPKDIENICYPVFNEDGSILKDYNIVVDSDTDDVTKYSMDKKPEKEADVFSPPKENCTHASEFVQNFLSEYKVNSSKKEKRIARVKQIRQKIAAKRLKSKLRKEKNRMVKQMLCSENSQLDYFPNIDKEKSGQDVRKLTWNFSRANGLVDSRGMIRNDNGVLNKIDSGITTLVERTFKPKKRKKKKKKKKNGTEIANTQILGDTSLQSQTSEIGLQPNVTLTPAPSDPNSEKSKVTAATEINEVVPASITAKAGLSSRPLFQNSPKKWKAGESALDFIPINTNSSRNSPPMSRSEREYAKFVSRLSQPNNEYMGISQKAYFLQY